MIGFLRGVLAAKRAPALVLDVHGVGYEVDVPMSTFFKLPEIGQELLLYTHFVVREDAHALFGFLSEDERSLFRSLIRVSGIGAKLALGVLSGVSSEEFHQCIRMEDAARLVRLPGIGKKTAERLIIELRDRLPDGPGISAASVAAAPGAPQTSAQEAVSALIALGFKPVEASALVRAIPAESKSSEELIRLALQSSAK